jgi:hypothetical protein
VVRGKPAFKLSLLGGRGSARSSPRTSRTAAGGSGAGQKGATDLFNAASSVMSNLSDFWGSGSNVASPKSPPKSRKQTSPRRK